MINRLLPFVLAFTAMPIASGVSYADENIDPSLVQQGYAISPIPPLKLRGDISARVGLGSYLVNAVGDCSGCHSFPQYLEKGDTAGTNPNAGDPFEGLPSSQSVADSASGRS